MSKRMTGKDRRLQIAAAARAVFIEKGFNGARTRDIADAAGINEALVYRHFHSKRNLFEVAVVEPLEQAISDLANSEDAKIGQFDESGELIASLTERHTRNMLAAMEEIAPLLGLLLFGNSSTSGEYFRERVEPLIVANQSIIERSMPYWSHVNFDSRLASEMGFAITFFRATVARLSGQKLDLDTEAAALAKIIMYGLALPATEAKS